MPGSISYGPPGPAVPERLVTSVALKQLRSGMSNPYVSVQAAGGGEGLATHLAAAPGPLAEPRFSLSPVPLAAKLARWNVLYTSFFNRTFNFFFQN